MAYYNRFDWGGISHESPSTYTEVWINASRSGAQVTVSATVKGSFTYPSGGGYLAYNGPIVFSMWTGNVSSSVNLKDYYNRWYASSEPSRTVSCSMTLTTTASAISMAFNVVSPDSDPHAMAVGTQVITLDVPGYSAPSAPTWLTSNPNPCVITQAPLLTWGGASVGSLGTLYYDVEVRSSTSSGGWTDWLRISSAQNRASYQEVALKNMSVYGVTPYVGVSYQYRVRSSDGSYATSGWITVTIPVSFQAPNSPTTSSLSANRIKRKGNVTMSWGEGTGGSGDISYYEVDYRIYNHTTSLWSDWIEIYESNTRSYTFDLSNLYLVSNGVYAIQTSIDTDYVFQIKDASTADQAKVVLGEYTGVNNQKFNITYRGNGFYEIKNVNSGKVLEAYGGTITRNKDVTQYTDNDSDAQQWLFLKNDDGSYCIRPKLSFNLYVDTTNGVAAEGTQIEFYPKNNTVAQKYTLVRTDGGTIESPVLTNGDVIQFRVRTVNSWGQTSPYLNIGNVSVRGNQMWIKINDTWVEGEVYLKTNDAWVEGTPYVKINDTWQESI